MSDERTEFEARLELSAALAPEFRNASEAMKRRRIKVVDKDGNVKAEITGSEFLEGAAKRVALEFDTFEAEEKRAKEARLMFTCEVCKREHQRVSLRGAVPKRCQEHRYKTICPGCGKLKSRGGKVCATCTEKSRHPDVLCITCGTVLGERAHYSGSKRCQPCWIALNKKDPVACIRCSKILDSKHSSRRTTKLCKPCWIASRRAPLLSCLDCGTALNKVAHAKKNVRCKPCAIKNRYIQKSS